MPRPRLPRHLLHSPVRGYSAVVTALKRGTPTKKTLVLSSLRVWAAGHAFSANAAAKREPQQHQCGTTEEPSHPSLPPTRLLICSPIPVNFRIRHCC